MVTKLDVLFLDVIISHLTTFCHQLVRLCNVKLTIEKHNCKFVNLC